MLSQFSQKRFLGRLILIEGHMFSMVHGELFISYFVGTLKKMSKRKYTDKTKFLFAFFKVVYLHREIKQKTFRRSISVL